MNVTEINAKLDKLRDKLEDLEIDRADLESSLESIDSDIDEIEDEIWKLEESIKQFTQTSKLLQVYESGTPTEAALALFEIEDVQNNRPSLFGQMHIEDYWCISNGYMAVFCKEKIDGLDEIEPIDVFKSYIQDKYEITETVDYIPSDEMQILLGNQGITINNTYLKLACCILGSPKQVSLTPKLIFFETEKGKAIILPIVKI